MSGITPLVYSCGRRRTQNQLEGATDYGRSRLGGDIFSFDVLLLRDGLFALVHSSVLLIAVYDTEHMDTWSVPGFCWKTLLKYCSETVKACRVPVAFPHMAAVPLLDAGGPRQHVLPTLTTQPKSNYIQKLSVGYWAFQMAGVRHR